MTRCYRTLLVVAVAAVSLTMARPALADGDATSEEVLRQAGAAYSGGQASKAADLYRSFLKAHADHSQALEARYQLARCCDMLGLVDEAIDQLNAVVQSGQKKFPHRKDALYLLGKLQGSLKNYDKAVAALEAMLAEGDAGLDEDEVMDRCASYYAILKKTDEAAAKFNILKRREGSRYAQQAANKLVVLWLGAGRADLATTAIEELAHDFPQDPHIPGLIVQAADLFARDKKPDQAVALCDEVIGKFPNGPDAPAARYVLAGVLRDRKDFAKAVEVFEQIAKSPQIQKQPLAVEALFQAAELSNGELSNPDKAMQLYQEAATVGRDIDNERTKAVTEQCYFILAEHYYQKKNYPVALEYYLLLRGIGSKVNVTGRILRCQAERGAAGHGGEDSGRDSAGPALSSAEDLAFIRKKIDENPNTFVAAEGEVFLLDRELADAVEYHRDAAAVAALADRYESLLKKYKPDLLAQQSLGTYIRFQMGVCLSAGWQEGGPPPKDALEKAMALFAQVADADEGGPAGPYGSAALERLAAIAEQLGQRDKAFATYKRLFDASAASLEKAAANRTGPADKAAAELEKTTSQYLKSMLTRADAGDAVDNAIALARQVIEQKGAFSTLARDAQFYLGELYFLKKDYSAAARQFAQFVKMYGPKQDADGNVASGPWKPAEINDAVLQVYDAALRIANSWYMQGHGENTVNAYAWLARNFPVRNPHLAEANYWLAVELAKAPDADKPEGKRRLAETLWQTVVNSSLDFSDKRLAEHYHDWVRSRDSEAEQYVKAGMMRAGKMWVEAGDHDKAAAAFEAYLQLYSPQARAGRQSSVDNDEMYSIARYALGRECIALGNVTRLLECYKPYLTGLRSDRFRVSALRLLAFHAGQAGRFDEAIDAYATLLDEYGDNAYDKSGAVIPVPRKDWLRPGAGWDGVRLPPPKDFDAGEIRFALGLLYWRQDNFARCVQTLGPFLDDPSFAKNKVAGQALYMVGRSQIRLGDLASASAALERLTRDYPQFEAVEEAAVDAVRCCCELGRFKDVDRLGTAFLSARPNSDRRVYMELYLAASAVGQGKTTDGLSRLKGLVEGNTYEDVKGEACYYIARELARGDKPDDPEAMNYFEKSLAFYPRESVCLAAAKCCIRMNRLDQAKALLERVGREFPAGDRNVIAEAKALLAEISKKRS